MKKAPKIKKLLKMLNKFEPQTELDKVLMRGLLVRDESAREKHVTGLPHTDVRNRSSIKESQINLNNPGGKIIRRQRFTIQPNRYRSHSESAEHPLNVPSRAIHPIFTR